MLLLYDTILTQGQEHRYIWQSPKTWVSRVLYVWNRYILLLYFALDLGTISPVSDTSCTALVWLIQSVQILALAGPAMFTTLRIYALSERNRVLGGIALVLSMAPFVINATTAYQRQPVNLPPPTNCTFLDRDSVRLFMGLSIAARGCLIVVDSLAIAVTWRHTSRGGRRLASATRKRLSLEQVMWGNGSIYFCTLVSLNAINVALVIASTVTAVPEQDGDPESSYLLYFIDPISSVLNSRFLLALHETNTRLEGSTSVSVSSLCFDADADNASDAHTASRDGSPELPGYLRPLGGPVHSFHEEEDAESVEFARPARARARGERECELEGGVAPVADHAAEADMGEVS